jgi:hypothetical protein
MSIVFLQNIMGKNKIIEKKLHLKHYGHYASHCSFHNAVSVEPFFTTYSYIKNVSVHVRSYFIYKLISLAFMAMAIMLGNVYYIRHLLVHARRSQTDQNSISFSLFFLWMDIFQNKLDTCQDKTEYLT